MQNINEPRNQWLTAKWTPNWDLIVKVKWSVLQPLMLPYCRSTVWGSCVSGSASDMSRRRFCSPALPAVGLAGDICSMHVPPVIAGLTADVPVLGSLSEPTATAPRPLLMWGWNGMKQVAVGLCVRMFVCVGVNVCTKVLLKQVWTLPLGFHLKPLNANSCIFVYNPQLMSVCSVINIISPCSSRNADV